MHVEPYFDSSWKKDLYQQAMRPFEVEYPQTILEELESRTLDPPVITKKRDRPKKRRIESQGATLALDAPRQRKAAACGTCKEVGDNKRSCTSSATPTA